MIRGKTIILRTIREIDLDSLYARLSDLTARGTYVPLDLISETTFRRQFHEHGFWNDDYGRLLICDPEDRLLGSIWYFRAAPYFDGLEIGYQLFDTNRRNSGIMTEALSLLTHYLFATRKINRLQLAIGPQNIASKRVAEKCGFSFEGTARGAIFHQGSNHALAIYALIRTDLNSLEAQHGSGTPNGT
jgi:ribosomal-protein-alanine N-acetyltransferase